METKPIEIYGIETPDGCYVALDPEHNPYNSYQTGINTILFDGNYGEKTFHNNWVKLQKPPTRISHVQPPQTIYGDYQLLM